MTSFDLPTAYVIMGMLYLIMPLTIGYALRRVKARSVFDWCLGGVLFGLGLLFLGQRGRWPDVVTYELAVMLMNGAQLIRVGALSRENSSRLPPLLAISLLATYLLAYIGMRHAADADLRLHYPLSLFFLLVCLAWISVLAMRLAQRERVASALWLALVYSVLALVIGVQLLRALNDVAASHPLLSDWASIAMVLCGTLTAVIGNIAFMGIYVERAIRKQIEAAAQSAKLAEGQRLERHIAQLDRARGLGMISSSLAHELSQPLASLRLTAGQAQMEVEAGLGAMDRVAMHLAKILELSSHVSEVIQRIRNFVRNEPPMSEPVDLVQVHRSVESLIGNFLQSRAISLTLSQCADSACVKGDKVQLAQVLLNVYRNAYEAVTPQESGVVSVQLHCDKDNAWVTILDNGPGFSAEVLARDREGFFSTKSGGLGMGLLISRQIVEAHGGQLRISNRGEGGACVEIILPRDTGQSILHPSSPAG